MGLSSTFRTFDQDIYPRLQLPAIDPLVWSFALRGKVRHPLILSYADLQALPREEVSCAAPCAGDVFTAAAVEVGSWSGVPLRTLIEEVEIQPDARYAIIHNATGYSTSLSLARLQTGLLALEQDGAPLTGAQGFPARLIVPGLYGYKMPRWVTRIEFTESRAGFWESRGWNEDGVAPTTAAIVRPYHRSIVSKNITLEGFAFSAEYPVLAVEVSVDYADWMPVEFEAAAPAQLVPWHIHWTPPAPGDYGIRARAAHGITSAQTNAVHSIVVHVRE
jgi:DMSO/TMAO reductase YedYZ molybdopterin-dependent catalytic subunit